MGYLIQDAGHGGKDPGASANSNIEKEYTLEAALCIHRFDKENSGAFPFLWGCASLQDGIAPHTLH
jgi:hypothetical protein